MIQPPNFGICVDSFDSWCNMRKNARQNATIQTDLKIEPLPIGIEQIQMKPIEPVEIVFAEKDTIENVAGDN